MEWTVSLPDPDTSRKNGNADPAASRGKFTATSPGVCTQYAEGSAAELRAIEADGGARYAVAAMTIKGEGGNRRAPRRKSHRSRRRWQAH